MELLPPIPSPLPQASHLLFLVAQLSPPFLQRVRRLLALLENLATPTSGMRITTLLWWIRMAMFSWDVRTLETVPTPRICSDSRDYPVRYFDMKGYLI